MTANQSFYISKQERVRWFLLILLVKVVWLFLFTWLRNPEWNPKLSVGVLGIYGGDTQTYYYPVEQLIETGQYYGMCRMPGVLPVYAPLRIFMGLETAQQTIVILQVLFDSLATLLLAIIAARMFQRKSSFITVIVLACATTFVSIRSMYLLSDSLCISALITSVYFLYQFLSENRKSFLIYAGIFLAWSIFLRQISILAIPVMGFILLYHFRKSWLKAITAGMILAIPLAVSLSAWTIRNKTTYDRWVILVPPLNECMKHYTDDFAAIRSLIIAMGEDYQPWSAGSAADWFFRQPIANTTNTPFEESQYTSAMQLSDLHKLRDDYRTLTDSVITPSKYDSLSASVTNRAQLFKASYENEHAFDFHIMNRIRFLKQFFFPARIDDIPFPAANRMNILQKAIKAWSLVSLWLIHLAGFISILIFCIKKNWGVVLFAFLPLSFTLALGWMGFIEQRYLATSFPFFIVLIAGAIGEVLKETNKKEQIA
jgi:4-amino-4-deoxy-L-arabinose transferase-like glycosyltransferase